MKLFFKINTYANIKPKDEKDELRTSKRFAMQFAFKVAIFEASTSPLEPIMAMYVYEIGKISAEPQEAAEMVPRG